MRFLTIVLNISIFILLITSCSKESDYLVTIHTKYGDMKAVLYNQTPKHKQNFIELAKSGKYDSTLFHRVIKGFMVQGGDINRTSNKKPIDYKIPAEFVDSLYHIKGALAAARQGDQVNPAKESSGSQFYIVEGKKFTEDELVQIANNERQSFINNRFRQLLSMQKYRDLRQEVIKLKENQQYDAIMQKVEESLPLIEKEFGEIPETGYTKKQKEIYSTEGGAPHLDGQYTVFGQVVDGFNVIDSIASIKTGQGDKPVEDIYVTVSVEEMRVKKMAKLYDLPANF